MGKRVIKVKGIVLVVPAQVGAGAAKIGYRAMILTR